MNGIPYTDGFTAKIKYIITKNINLFIVGRAKIGSETYDPICFCKDESKANKVMEALAYYEQQNNTW
jgi:hypothetical protein